jgi:hypothetical protein
VTEESGKLIGNTNGGEKEAGRRGRSFCVSLVLKMWGKDGTRQAVRTEV